MSNLKTTKRRNLSSMQHVGIFFMRTYHDGITMSMLALTGRVGLSRLKMNEQGRKEESKEINSVKMWR
jgi:hypothetical protein